MKKRLFWVIFSLIFLVGCYQYRTQPDVKTSTPLRTASSTSTTVSPSQTPSPYPTATKLPTITITPTKEQTIYQKLTRFGKGDSILLVGANDSNDTYSYLLLSNSGKINTEVKLKYPADSFSNDLRFNIYRDDNSGYLLWSDLDSKEERHRLPKGCVYSAWSKDNTKLALLCENDIKILEYKDSNWTESISIQRPEKLKDLPEDALLLNLPIWMKDGFAFFIDYSGIIKDANWLKEMYFLSNACLDDPTVCNLNKPKLSMDIGPNLISAIAASPDGRFLVIAYSTKGEIRVYDLQTQQIIKKFNVSSIDSGLNEFIITSMIWRKQDNQLLFTLVDSSKVYSISNFDLKSVQTFFNCEYNHVYDLIFAQIEGISIF